MTRFSRRKATEHPLYRTWRGMLSRCSDPGSQAFKNYGGRGIRVCDRWRDHFFAFAADMGAKPSELHSLDRVNNDGNYEPSNCRWATWPEQAANRRPPPSQRFEWNGELLTRAELAERLGLRSRQAANYRLGLTPRQYTRKTARPYTCRNCGAQGHQAKTCNPSSK